MITLSAMASPHATTCGVSAHSGHSATASCRPNRLHGTIRYADTVVGLICGRYPVSCPYCCFHVSKFHVDRNFWVAATPRSCRSCFVESLRWKSVELTPDVSTNTVRLQTDSLSTYTW